MQEVSSYILTLVGTTPANPKEPQGELMSSEAEAPAEVMDSTNTEMDSTIVVSESVTSL